MRFIENLFYDFLDGPYLIGGLIAAVAILVAVFTVFGVADARAEAACLRAGYPGATIDWALNAYCIKRVDQTDVVVPLGTVQAK